MSEAALAKICTQKCFAEADTDHSGSLSYPEFRDWYGTPACAAICCGAIEDRQ